jgi:hypothetical protein
MRGYLLIGACTLILVPIMVLGWSCRPQRLEVEIGEPETVYSSNSGEYEVLISLHPLGNDNGPVEVIVSTEAGVSVIRSMYNYDLFSEQPAGTLARFWMDGDIWPDVIIAPTEPAEIYFVSSQDGLAYRVLR